MPNSTLIQKHNLPQIAFIKSAQMNAQSYIQPYVHNFQYKCIMCSRYWPTFIFAISLVCVDGLYFTLFTLAIRDDLCEYPEMKSATSTWCRMLHYPAKHHVSLKNTDHLSKPITEDKSHTATVSSHGVRVQNEQICTNTCSKSTTSLVNSGVSMLYWRTLHRSRINRCFSSSALWMSDW